MPKILIDPEIPLDFFPGMDTEIAYRGESDEKQSFRVVITRNELNPRHAKYMLLNRHRTKLLRLEIGGSPHPNPNGVIVPCPHLHKYREGFDLGYAAAIKDRFGDPSDLEVCLIGFLQYCQALRWPKITKRGGLF